MVSCIVLFTFSIALFPRLYL